MLNHNTILLTALLTILLFIVPKKYFILPYVIVVCFIPFDQRVIIFDLDFTPLRLLVIFGVLRVLAREEQREIRWNYFDKMVFVWAFVGATIYVIQWADTRSLINRSGMLFDIIGLYWLFRQNVYSWENVDFIIKYLAIAAIISALMVLVERVTEHNPFALLGNVGTGMHRGRYRCRGSFEHSIILGLFWVNLFPIFIGYAIIKHSRAFYWWTAAAACVAIVYSTGSSTPWVTLIWVALLLPLFRYRHLGKLMALGLFGLLSALHIVMNKPVWHLICRLRFISGSTGWHRYRLINEAINHFHEWSLLGTQDTSHWGYGLQDITNNYIRQGVNGGFVTMMLLIIVMFFAIRICGRYSLQDLPKEKQWLGWAFCISVLGHAMSFLGVSYFGKMPVLLYLTFAVVAMVADKQRMATTTNFVSDNHNWQNALGRI